MRRDIDAVIESLVNAGIGEVSLTTNGVLLAGRAAALRRAGLSRVNVSLDTLRPDRFKAITGLGRWADAWNGILAALDAGLAPVKINVVVMAGVNDDEIHDFADLACRLPVQVRFIETMPVGPASFDAEGARVPASEMEQRLRSAGFVAVPGEAAGPVGIFRKKDAAGSLGLISPMTRPFCSSCNRIRVTAQGRLVLCLGSTAGVELKPWLVAAAPAAVIARRIARAVLDKPLGHSLHLAAHARPAVPIWRTGG